MDVTIRNLQEYTAHLYKQYNDDHGLFMKLVEEVGEVAEVMNKRTGRKANNGEDAKAELANELADLLHYAIAIAAVNDIDLTYAILKKDESAAMKYHHDVNLKRFIKAEKE